MLTVCISRSKYASSSLSRFTLIWSYLMMKSSSPKIRSVWGVSASHSAICIVIPFKFLTALWYALPLSSVDCTALSSFEISFLSVLKASFVRINVSGTPSPPRLLQPDAAKIATLHFSTTASSYHAPSCLHGTEIPNAIPFWQMAILLRQGRKIK